jgi:L-rhamnose mutarotase
MSRGGPDVERVCFMLRVRQDRLDEYKEAHRPRSEEVFHLE